MSDVLDFTCHSAKQEQAIMSDAKTTALITGIQYGKTTAGALWMKRLNHTFTDPHDNFIITAPNYKILNQSTLPAYLKYMDGYGRYNKVDAQLSIYGGGTVYFRTATEPDSIVGITNVRGIWGDEAGKYSLYFWENIQARASFKDCPILLTTSPYTANWLYRDIIKKTKAGQRPDVNLIQASSNENPFFPKEEFERRKAVMDPARFAALYLGEFEKMHGLVYDCFDEDIHVIEPYMLPFGTKYYAGIDWGHTDPFVIQVLAVLPNGMRFLVSEFYKTKLTVTDMILIAKQKKQIFGIETYYADPSQPGYIEEFNRNGLPCVPAFNDIRRGIDAMYEVIRIGKFKVFNRCAPHTIDEISGYHYPEPDDLEPDQDSKEQLPVGQHDHTMDALRYVNIMTYRSELKHTPKVAEPLNPRQITNHEERLKILRKSKKQFHGSEEYS